MRYRLITIAVLAAFLSAAPASFAQQEQPEGQKLSLSLVQAQDFASLHNATLQNASLDIRRAEAAKWKSIASMLPQISAGVDYSNYFGYKMNIGAMQIAMPPYASLGVTTAVGLSGASFISVGIAEISKRMADLTRENTEQQVRDQVKVLYYSALVTEETIRVLEENLASLRKLHEMSQRSVEIGVAEQTSADQLKVQVGMMENSISSTRRSLEMIYNTLRLQLNVGTDTAVQLTQSLDELVNLATAEALLSEEFDIEDNRDFRLLKESTELARRQIALTGWSNGPTISVFHQYNTRKYFSDEATMNMTPPNMLGVSLKVPLFTSGMNSMSIRDARLSYQKQLNTLESTALSMQVQYHQLVWNLRSALESYYTQKENVEVAQRIFDNIAGKYEYGVASSLELTNAGTTLLSARSSYVQALMDIVNAQISLEQLLNK